MKNHVLQIITFANDKKTRNGVLLGTNGERRELKAEAGATLRREAKRNSEEFRDK